ncbi:hypothetical protein Bca101_071113 [Brassica carinata]
MKKQISIYKNVKTNIRPDASTSLQPLIVSSCHHLLFHHRGYLLSHNASSPLSSPLLPVVSSLPSTASLILFCFCGDFFSFSLMYQQQHLLLICQDIPPFPPLLSVNKSGRKKTIFVLGNCMV